MSHFAVLVVGEDIAKQLQPYHEFECTEIDDQYVQEIDVTEECKKHGLDWYGLEDKTVTNEAQIDRKNKHKYGFAIIDNKGNLVKAVNRTNPNKKWDWWTIGGRWSDYFLLKDGTRASYGFKKEIDFETMKEGAGLRAGNLYDEVYAVIGDAFEKFIPWKTMMLVHKNNFEQAQKEYSKQTAIKRLRKNRDLALRVIGLEDFLISREEYVQNAKDDIICTFAVVKDSQWYEKGEMGWWEMVDDEKDPDVWRKEFHSLIENLSEETLLTIVDCHI